MSLVEFKHVYKSFDKKDILKDINFTIPKGEIIGLLGKNGMGKTTIIKLINDLLTPTSGEVLVNGKKPGVESKKSISFLPERTYLNKSLTVKQVFNYFMDFYNDFNLEKARKLHRITFQVCKNSSFSDWSLLPKYPFTSAQTPRHCGHTCTKNSCYIVMYQVPKDFMKLRQSLL